MAEAHTLGVVGTGALGAALAAAALDDGIATSVWNRTPGKARHLVDAGATPRNRVRNTSWPAPTTSAAACANGH